MVSEEKVMRILREFLFELFIIEHEAIKAGDKGVPQLAYSIHRVRAQLSNEEITVVEREAAAYIAKVS
jgi:hypothetical protein